MSDETNHASASRTWRRWIPEFFLLSQQRMRGPARILGLSSLVGFVAGLGAIVFYLSVQTVEHTTMAAIAGYQPEPHPAGETPISWLPVAGPHFYPWLLVVVTTLGGLASGVIVYTLAPETEGHGTDNVIAAYHLKQGYMRPRAPLVKIVASAITIGTGGSGGREGPIAQIGAGFGSVLAGLVGLRRPNDACCWPRAWARASAPSFAPAGRALFAAEVLYRSPEFEAEVILPAALASVIAYSTFASVYGWDPLFDMPNLTFTNPWQLLPYLVLATFMALLAMVYTRTFYGIHRLFHRMKIVPHVRPAIGALLTALVGISLYYAFGQRAQSAGRDGRRLLGHPGDCGKR